MSGLDTWNSYGNSQSKRLPGDALRSWRSPNAHAMGRGAQATDGRQLERFTGLES
jgi:hypothetical protein